MNKLTNFAVCCGLLLSLCLAFVALGPTPAQADPNFPSCGPGQLGHETNDGVGNVYTCDGAGNWTIVPKMSLKSGIADAGFNNVVIIGNTTAKRPISQSAGATNATSPVLVSGELNINTTPVGNAADTTEDNLMTYTLPGGSLDANNRAVRVTAWGTGVSTADVTTVKCYFGATAVITRTLTASQANTWRTVFEVVRTGATAQIATGEIINGGAAVGSIQLNTSPAETLAGNVVVKCTGQRATTSSANSVQQLGMVVEFFN